MTSSNFTSLRWWCWSPLLLQCVGIFFSVCLVSRVLKKIDFKEHLSVAASKYSLCNIENGMQYSHCRFKHTFTVGFKEFNVVYIFFCYFFLFTIIVNWSSVSTGLYKAREYAKILCKLYFKDSQCFECLEFWIC